MDVWLALRFVSATSEDIPDVLSTWVRTRSTFRFSCGHPKPHDSRLNVARRFVDGFWACFACRLRFSKISWCFAHLGQDSVGFFVFVVILTHARTA